MNKFVTTIMSIMLMIIMMTLVNDSKLSDDHSEVILFPSHSASC